MINAGLILVDGLPADSIQAMDRGLHYGDGVFRTLKVMDGEICWWADHYRKLEQDCVALNIVCPEQTLLLSDVRKLAGQFGVGAIKIIVTRGLGQRGYVTPDASLPMRIVMGFPASPAKQCDVQVRWCNLRLGNQPKLAGIKHLNRLENVLARAEWNSENIAEGLLMDEAGRVVCGTMSNLFLLEGNRLVTPGLAHCGVAGVTRERLLRAATRNNLSVSIEEISPSRLLAADEVFLTNSLIEVWRVAKLDEKIWDDSGIRKKLVSWLHEENQKN